WQYSDSGTGSTYGAASTAIDQDVYNGTATQLQSFVIGGPKTTVTYNGGVNIADGQTSPAIDFGAVDQGAARPQVTFLVRNTGTQTLTLGAVNVPGGFNLVEGLSTSLAVGASDTFTVEMLTNPI